MNLSFDIPEQLDVKYNIQRYPKTDNKSLKPWNKADEFMISFVDRHQLNHQSILIVNDSFGFLTSHLASPKTIAVYNLKSQYDAILKNLEFNQIQFSTNQFITPIESLENKVDLAVLKIPKSLELFELYLQQISKSISKKGIVVCGFMTKYFTPQLIKIAQKYFSEVRQTKAWKKSRLMILSKPVQKDYGSQIRLFESKYGEISQFNGVFSSGHIDYATQFLIDNLDIPPNAGHILDLASGNGILAKVIKNQKPSAQIHLVDDSFLAIESSKLNVKGEHIYFHHQYNLQNFNNDYFDYVVSNPPFHIGHEIDLSLPTQMFKDASRVLKPNGIFELVANRHLIYKPILKQLFNQVEIKAQNSRFVVYRCYQNN